MKAELVDGALRLEGGTLEEKSFLRRLHNGLVEPQDAHADIFHEVYPFKTSFFRRISLKRSSELWKKWMSIRLRVRSALFHDGSLILDVEKPSNKGAQT